MISVTLMGKQYRDVQMAWEVYASAYLNGPIVAALQLYNDGEFGTELLTTATVNLEGFRPSAGCVYIKTWSENEDLVESLVEAGVLELTGYTIKVNDWGSVAVEARVLDPYANGMQEAIARAQSRITR